MTSARPPGQPTGPPATSPAASPAPGGIDGLREVLRLTVGRWDGIDGSFPYRGLVTVGSAWALLAWARFGAQAVEGPRAVLRFLLVGIYVWLAQAAVVWAVGRLAGRAGRRGPMPGPTRALQFTGLAHQPVVILGLALQIGAILPLPLLFTGLAVATLLAWFPAQLVTAMVSAFGRVDRWSLVAATVAYGGWLALAGRYLLPRIGHLI